MFRGFLSGIIWGTTAVVGVVGLASLLAPLPATVSMQTDTVDTTTGSDKQDETAMGEGSQTDDAVSEAQSPQVDPVGEGDQLMLADTDSAPQPAVAEPTQSMMAPETSSDSGMGSAVSDSPVEAITAVPAPSAPPAKDELSITTDPDQPVAPSLPETEGAFVTPQEPEQDMTPSAEDASEAPAMDVTVGDDGSMLKPAGDLKETFEQHASTRLPSVGGAAEEVAEMAMPQRPFDLNAADFGDVGGKPMMAVVLLDDGSTPLDTQILSSFPFPLTFAVNTLSADVADRVAAYRGMGFEVLAMIDIPAAAAPSDVEVALDAHLSVMPDAVGVMEGTQDGLQGNKPLSDQVAEVLLASGHGLVMFPKGLNTAQKLASREGVPAATVFRDFDNKGQSAAIIRRFLDQAAFKADQEGGVIMVGRLREQTISALMLWGLQDRASTVALAPVSAILRAKQP